MEALRELCGQRSRRSPGQGVRGTSLSSRGQAACAGNGEGYRAGHGTRHRQPFLDVGGNKAEALEKLHTVANKIGYPDKWRDYSTLSIARDDELGNILRSRAFEFHRQLAKIGKPVDRGEWGMTPPTVNAYYNPAVE